MATAAQLSANRSNAQSSTGPRTEAGKAASSLNALRDGLTSAKLFIRPESRDQFEVFQASLLQETKPEGALQMHLFDVILHAAWNIQRIITLEADLQREAFTRGLLDAAFDDELALGLDRIYRYKKMHETALRRSTVDLRMLQNETVVRQQGQTISGESILVNTNAVSRATIAWRKVMLPRAPEAPAPAPPAHSHSPFIAEIHERISSSPSR